MIGPRWVPPALAQRAGPEVLALVITILIGIPAWTGVFVGLTGAAATTPSSSPAATETAPVTTPVTRPTASPDDGPPPSPNAGLLRVAIVLDGRISESGARLKSRLDAPGLDAEGALYELGLLNGIATDGLGVADRLAADPATATIGSQLGAAYRDLREAAVPALASVADAATIRDAGRAVVAVVTAIAPITDAMTTLLASAATAAPPTPVVP